MNAGLLGEHDAGASFSQQVVMFSETTTERPRSIFHLGAADNTTQLSPVKLSASAEAAAHGAGGGRDNHHRIVWLI